MHEFFDFILIPHGKYCVPVILALPLGIVNIVIALSYFAIPYYMRKFGKLRPDYHEKKTFYLFKGFIGFCGLSHLMSAIVLYWAIFEVQLLILVFTSILSVLTVLYLARNINAVTLSKLPFLEKDVDLE